MWKYRTRERELQAHRRPLTRRRGMLARRLLRSERGATAIEFALVGPVVILLIVAFFEFMAMMAVGNSLDAATNLSSRLGKTGYVDEGATQKATIMAEVERLVGPLIDMDKLSISHEVYNDFQSLTIPDLFEDQNGDGDTDDPGEWTDVDADGFRDGSDGLGTAGNIVVYRINYPWEVMTPFMSKVLDDGIIELTAYSVVKNEPY